MLVPIKWLNEYVNIEDVDVKVLEEALIMSGSNTEGIHDIKKRFSKVVVSQIVKIEQHPNADKLVICQADIGLDDKIQIVTGAKNMKEGDYVPLALNGAVLADGLKIKSGKLRGEKSEGMFCSLQELGFDDKVIPKSFLEGLLIIEGSCTPGQDIATALDFDDCVIEFEITPNRSDCLSMIGMARETAATFNKTFTPPNTSIVKEVGSISGEVKVEVKAPEKCHRYSCKVVEDVIIKPSPQWLQSKLIKAGMRPINNIVDITNYVLLEYGQPVHAFDLDKVTDQTIIVRQAQKGEQIKTLDNTLRTLTEDMLVIADTKEPLAIAGIMGGGESEVSTATTRLLIEVANFDRANIRETSKVLGLRTEASSRFEKGISSVLVMDALNRVCHLIEQLGCGTVVGGVIDTYSIKQEIPQITVRPERMNALIGTCLSTEEMVNILTALNCDVVQEEAVLLVKPPYYRLDLKKEVDFSEEIARIYGYDRIEETQPKDYEIGFLTPIQAFEKNITTRLTGLGLSQILTYSFISEKVIDLLNDSENPNIKNNVIIKNPLGEEFSVMRPSLLPNMLQTVARNLKRQVPSVQLYEIGNIFIANEEHIISEPTEVKKLVLGFSGDDIDFYDLKGTLDSLFCALKIEGIRYLPDFDNSTYHPGRCAKVLIGEVTLGYLGEIHPSVQDSFEIPNRTYSAELDLQKMFEHRIECIKYKTLPKFPAAMRDIAITVDEDITNQVLTDLIYEYGGKYLDGVSLFDVYKGEQIEDGKKSMAYALSFRAEDRTLVEEDIKTAFDAILNALEIKVNAILR